MANLEGMPIGSLPEATSIQDEDEIVVYRPSTGKAYQANTDLIERIDSVELTLESSFELYNASNPVKAYKSGNVVTVYGVVKPTSTISGSSSNVNIARLPSGYRPPSTVYTVCNGSATNKWLLSVSSSGYLMFGRYGTTDYADCSISAWLPFSITFIASES